MPQCCCCDSDANCLACNRAKYIQALINYSKTVQMPYNCPSPCCPSPCPPTACCPPSCCPPSYCQPSCCLPSYCQPSCCQPTCCPTPIVSTPPPTTSASTPATTTTAACCPTTCCPTTCCPTTCCPTTCCTTTCCPTTCCPCPPKPICCPSPCLPPCPAPTPCKPCPPCESFWRRLLRAILKFIADILWLLHILLMFIIRRIENVYNFYYAFKEANIFLQIAFVLSLGAFITSMIVNYRANSPLVCPPPIIIERCPAVVTALATKSPK